MPHPNFYTPEVQDVAADRLNLDLDPRPVLEALWPGDGAQYETTLRAAFDFFRRHADRRYSSSSLMTLQNSADMAERLRLAGDQPDLPNQQPTVMVAESPFVYDEETEVKTGGVVGMAVVDHGHDEKLMIAVHNEKRRNGIATAMVHTLSTFGAWRLTSWVAPSNDVGQHFLLSTGFQPQAMNRMGTVCYGVSEIPSEDGAMLSDLEEAPRRRRPRARRNQARVSPSGGVPRDPFERGLSAPLRERQPRAMSTEEMRVINDLCQRQDERQHVRMSLRRDFPAAPPLGDQLRTGVRQYLRDYRGPQDVAVDPEPLPRVEAYEEEGGTAYRVVARTLTEFEEGEVQAHGLDEEHRILMRQALLASDHPMDDEATCQWATAHRQNEIARRAAAAQRIEDLQRQMRDMEARVPDSPRDA